jgi:hypothetical protein
MSADNYALGSAAQPVLSDGMTSLSRTAAARQLVTALTSGPASPVDCHAAIASLGTNWLNAQRLASFTWWICRNSPLSEDLQRDLRRAYYAAAGDAELHRRELAYVLRQLNSWQIQAVVFKGVALSYGVYPDPACRTMGDIDLWVAGEDVERARQALSELGYEAFRKPDRPLALMAMLQGEVGLQHSHSAYGLVELHWGVFPGEWLGRAAAVNVDDVKRRVAATTLAGEATQVLAPEDAIVQSAIHTAINHQMSMSPLRGLVDIALLARHCPIDWTLVVQRARTWRVATALWLVLSLAVDLAGLEEAAEAAQQLQPSALRRRLIGCFASAESLVMMRDLSASKWRYVFLLLLVDHSRDAVKLIFRALWPEREWLIARYGRYGFSTRLRHLFDAAQGKI